MMWLRGRRFFSHQFCICCRTWSLLLAGISEYSLPILWARSTLSTWNMVSFRKALATGKHWMEVKASLCDRKRLLRPLFSLRLDFYAVSTAFLLRMPALRSLMRAELVVSSAERLGIRFVHAWIYHDLWIGNRDVAAFATSCNEQAERVEISGSSWAASTLHSHFQHWPIVTGLLAGWPRWTHHTSSHRGTRDHSHIIFSNSLGFSRYGSQQGCSRWSAWCRPWFDDQTLATNLHFWFCP